MGYCVAVEGLQGYLAPTLGQRTDDLSFAIHQRSEAHGRV